MNSSQRRRTKRHFTFIVTIPASHAERYFQYDGRVEDAVAWCRKQFKKDAWQSAQYWDHSEFKFVKESDSLLFMLKWV